MAMRGVILLFEVYSSQFLHNGSLKGKENSVGNAFTNIVLYISVGI